MKVRYKEFRKDGLVIFYMEHKEYRLKVLRRGELEFLDFYNPFDIKHSPEEMGVVVEDILIYANRNKCKVFIKKVTHDIESYNIILQFFEGFNFKNYDENYLAYIPKGVE